MSSTASIKISGGCTDDSINNLSARLRSLQNDIEYYNRLKIHAQKALESHRGDLTLLQQKERAIFAAKEDELRLQLQNVLCYNYKMLCQIEEFRCNAYQELREELLATRTENSTRLNSLQEEMDMLWRERLNLEHELTYLEGETNKLKDVVQDDLHKQLYLQKEVRKAKQDLTDTIPNPLAAQSPCNVHSKGALESSTPLKASIVPSNFRGASPKKQFIPSGPTITLERSAPPSRPSNCHCSAARSFFSPPPASHRWRNGFSNSPVSHNVVSMVSTLERRNYLRPRTYLQRHSRDMNYQSSAIKVIRDAPFPLLCPPQMVTTPQTILSPHPECSSEANKVVVKTYAGFFPKNKAVEESTHSLSVSEPVEKNRRTSSVQQDSRHRDSDLHELCGYTEDCTKPLGSVAPNRVSRTLVSKETSLDTLCRTLKEEIVQLKKSYAAFYSNLHNPQCDSVAASQQMRQLMGVIDQKTNQLQVLRSLKREHRKKLRIHKIMKQVERENNWCEKIYSGIVHLVRSS